MKKENVIKGFKGFNKDLTCRGFQFKEGEVYETDKTPVRCTENGFHFCLEPLDILRYYSPVESVFHYVEGFGNFSTDKEDSKIAVSKIKIGAKIGIGEFCKLAIEMVMKRCKTKAKENSGYSGLASNSGDGGLASNSGYRGLASNSGYGGLASNSGDGGLASNSGDGGLASNSGDRGLAETNGANSLAVAFGILSKAKACLNSYITISEWVYENNGWVLKTVKSAKIDGKKLKADTWYKLQNGKFVISE